MAEIWQVPDSRAFLADWLAQRQAAVDAAAQPTSGLDRFLKALSTGLLAANRNGGGAILGSLVGAVRSPQDVAREKLAGLDDRMKGYATALKASDAEFDSQMGRDKALRAAGPPELSVKDTLDLQTAGVGPDSIRSLGGKPIFARLPKLDFNIGGNPLTGNTVDYTDGVLAKLTGKATAPSAHVVDGALAIVGSDGQPQFFSPPGGGRDRTPAHVQEQEYWTKLYQGLGPKRRAFVDQETRGRVDEMGNQIPGRSLRDALVLANGITEDAPVGGTPPPSAAGVAAAQQEVRDRIAAKRGSAGLLTGPPVMASGPTGIQLVAVNGQPVGGTAVEPGSAPNPGGNAGAAAPAPSTKSPLLQMADQLDAQRAAETAAFAQRLADEKKSREADTRDFEASVAASRAQVRLPVVLAQLNQAQARADKILAGQLRVSGADARALETQIADLRKTVAELKSQAAFVSPKYSRR